MTLSAIQLLLKGSAGHALEITQAIRSGEVDIIPSLSRGEPLLHDLLSALRNTDSKTEARWLSQLELFCEVHGLGGHPWPPKSASAAPSYSEDTLDLAFSVDQPYILRYLAGLPDCPSDLVQRTVKDAKAADFDGWLPSAVASRRPEMTRTLLELGFAPLVCDAEGNGLLHHAKDPATIEVLLKFGLDPYLPNAKGISAWTAWDKLVGITAQQRDEIEVAIQRWSPLPEIHKQSMVKDFGSMVEAVGITRAKSRLAHAGLPTSSEYAGLPLPGLVMAHGLKRLFRGLNNAQNPAALDGWRKRLVSTIELCRSSLVPDRPLSSGGSLRALGWVFDGCCQQVVNTTQDESLRAPSRQHLMSWLNEGLPSPLDWPPDDVCLFLPSTIEHLVSHGLVDNGAEISGLMLRHLGMVAPEKLLLENEEGLPLLLALARQSSRGQWDTLWQGPEGSRRFVAVAFEMKCPEEIWARIALHPLALSSTLGLFYTRPDHSSPPELMLKQGATLSFSDPMTAPGIAWIEKTKDGHELAIELTALAQQVDLNTGTAPANALAGRRLPRL